MKCQRIGCIEFSRLLMRRRSPLTDSRLHTPLKRCLNAPQLILYCISHMIGAGLYVLTGQLNRDFAGSAAAIAYFVSAVTSIFTALCYAEFSTLFPRAGSAYLYTYLMFGELPAFLIGWTMISDIVVSTAAVSKAFSGTINWLTNGTIQAWSDKHLSYASKSSTVFDSSPDLIAAGFLLLLIIITITGASISLNVNALLSGIQIISLVAIILACFIFGSPKNLYVDHAFLPFGIGGLLRGAGLAVFGFSGFEAVANASEEAKNPRRDLPIAMFASLFICAFLYVGAALGLSYLIPRTHVAYDSPYVAGFIEVGQTGMMILAAFATLLATGATKLVAMYVIPRLFYSIASDGLLFGFLACIDKRTQVPIFSLLIGGFLTIILALFIKIQVLAEFTSVGLIFSYFIIGLDLMVLRYLFTGEEEVTDDKESEVSSASSVKKFVPAFTDKSPASELPLRKFVPQCLHVIGRRVIFRTNVAIFILTVLTLGVGINIGFRHYQSWVWSIVGVLVLILLVSFAGLCMYKPSKFSEGFETPAMPLTACVTMLTNGILITSLGPKTWIRFGVWSALGLVIYLSYGIWHSRADEQPKLETPETASIEDETEKSDDM